jgi:hypothetical protein
MDLSYHGKEFVSTTFLYYEKEFCGSIWRLMAKPRGLTQVSSKNNKSEEQSEAKSAEKEPQRKAQRDGSGYMQFLFESIYQIVTWVGIGLAIMGLGLSIGQHYWKGILWSGCALVCLSIVMLCLLAQRHLSIFQPAAANHTEPLEQPPDNDLHQQEKAPMTDEKPTHPKQKQGKINANVNIQAGRDVHYHPPQEPPLPISEIRYAVEKISSSNPAHPYGLEITIQTTVVIRSAAIRLEFDGPISDAFEPGFKIPGGIGAAYMGRVFNVHDNIYEFSFDGIMAGEFGPQRPLILRVYGTQPLKLIKHSLTY